MSIVYQYPVAGDSPPISLTCLCLSYRAKHIMRFNNADDLRAYLTSLEDIYEPYAAGMWMLGIRSTDMIVNSTKADMATVLAHPDPPGPSHQIHASDMIARSRPAGMLVRLHGGCQLAVSAIQSDFYLIDDLLPD